MERKRLRPAGRLAVAEERAHLLAVQELISGQIAEDLRVQDTRQHRKALLLLLRV
jgi:hypothetical protein